MMTHGMLWHLGLLLAWGRLMKISPFTFQTEFGLAPDHSAAPPSRPCRENTHHQKRSPPGQSLSPGDHCGNTWWHDWNARGLDVLRLLFPVKRFKPLGYDRSLWCLLSIELGNKRERRKSRRKGEEVGWGMVVMVVVMQGRGLLLEGNHLCGATPEEGGDALKPLF